MKRIVVASSRSSGGKTSMIVGIAGNLPEGAGIGYLKPFGDRLSYRKKRLWDLDSAMMTGLFGLKELPEDMSMGFSHSKLMFMYDRESTGKKVAEMADKAAAGRDLLIIEAGRELTYGLSVYLDPLSLAEAAGASLLVVLSGEEGQVIDDMVVLKSLVEGSGVTLLGVVVNKVPDVQDFKMTYNPVLEQIGLPVLGMIPYEKELTHLTMGFIADRMFAKVLSGQDGLGRIVEDVFVGAMSAEAAMHSPLFSREKKLIITSGDREDMILAALETDSAGVIITHNIVPNSHIIARAAKEGIPLLLVPYDTIQASRELDRIEPLLTKDDERKKTLLVDLVKRYVDLDRVLRV